MVDARTAEHTEVLTEIGCRSIWSTPKQRLKHLPAYAGDLGLIPELGRSPGEGNGNLLQYSCLENPMDWGAWWTTVHGVAKSRTWLSFFHFRNICSGFFSAQGYCYLAAFHSMESLQSKICVIQGPYYSSWTEQRLPQINNWFFIHLRTQTSSRPSFS